MPKTNLELQKFWLNYIILMPLTPIQESVVLSCGQESNRGPAWNGKIALGCYCLCMQSIERWTLASSEACKAAELYAWGSWLFDFLLAWAAHRLWKEKLPSAHLSVLANCPQNCQQGSTWTSLKTNSLASKEAANWILNSWRSFQTSLWIFQCCQKLLCHGICCSALQTKGLSWM